MKALRDQGFLVPDDISLAGIDDLPTAEAFSPTLTVAVQPTLEIGQEAVAQVLARLSGKSVGPPVHLLCEPRFIVRNSTRPLLRTEVREA